MPIYNIKGELVLFMHIPKAGGSTLEDVLAPYQVGLLDRKFCGKYFPCSPQHFHAEIIKSLITPEKIKLNFATVRHPLSRIISEYKFRRTFFNVNEEFNIWAVRMINERLQNPYVLDNHLRPQHEFLTEATEVFKLENNLLHVIEWLNVNLTADIDTGSILKQVMKSKEHEVQPHASTIDLIYETYKKDFEIFGYQ